MARSRIDDIDIQVGQRIRLHRNLQRMSQTDLGSQLGVSFQQIQKYEKGRSRIGAGRLNQIADVLGVPVAQFFESNERSCCISNADDSDPISLLEKQQMVRLVQSFAKIKDTAVRRSLMMVIEKIVGQQH